MTTARRSERGLSVLRGLIFAGLFAACPGYAATIAYPVVTPLPTDPAATTTPVTDPTVAGDPASVVLPADSVGATPYDPFANSELPVEINPALVPPTAQ